MQVVKRKLLSQGSSLLIAMLIYSATAVAQIDRIEPPFWWAGMDNSRLQLMVYGPNIAGTQVSSTDDAVTVVSVNSSGNNNYLFIELALDADLQPGKTRFVFALAGGATQVVDYEFRARSPGSAERQGFSARDVIYLITPDRFANGDPANDTVAALLESADRSNPDGRHGGDLQGIIDNLDYLQELGITQIWLNPLQENNQAQYSYHGYSISDLYQVDARFGGNDSLLELATQARERGIGLIMDTIPNHIGFNHWWMQDLPAEDWINSGGEFSPTSHRRETIQDPHAAEADRVAHSDGWFVPTMPDLNQRNEDLATYLIQNNIWWVEQAGLSGLRIDTLPYGDKQFTAKFNQALLREYPGLNIVGEEWSTNPAIVAYWQTGKQNIDGFAGNVPSLMDFPLQEALVKALKEPEGWNTGLIRLYQALANDFQYPDPNNLVVMGDNHDMSRLFSQLDEDFALYKMALTFLLTTRGIPQLFYGTEVLMNNPGTDRHGIIRSDFPGGWAGDQSNAFTGVGLAERAKDAHAFVSKLLNWRKTAPVIHSGKLTHFVPEEGIYSFFRHSSPDDDSMVLVVMNSNDQSASVDTARFAELTHGKRQATDVMSGQTQALTGVITVPPKTALIFELE